MKKLILGIIFVLNPLSLYANPSPFGLEIGSTTIKDLQSKYQTTEAGINKYSNGKMYSISNITFDGLSSVTAIFNNEEKLVAVLAELSKNKFNYLLESLSKKYQLISKNTPFVGNKNAKFFDDNTEITLEAPHLSFQMSMNYISKDLIKEYDAQSSHEAEEIRKKEQAAL